MVNKVKSKNKIKYKNGLGNIGGEGYFVILFLIGNLFYVIYLRIFLCYLVYFSVILLERIFLLENFESGELIEL